MNYLLLLDVAPEPVSTGLGIAGLVFVAIVVFMITAAVLLGAVFLFRRRRKTSGGRVMIGDACLSLDQATAPASSHTSPNQP